MELVSVDKEDNSMTSTEYPNSIKLYDCRILFTCTVIGRLITNMTYTSKATKQS